MNIKTHIVFDLDGTLADTQIIHQTIESNFLKKFWINIEPEQIWLIYAWRSPQEWIPELLAENNVDYTNNDIEHFVDSKDEQVISLLKKWEIKLMDWAYELLDNLHKDWYKIGISSGACREFISNFIEYFDLIMIESSTSANEVKNKKPHPDVFNKSFQVLEEKYWNPYNKWVIWDWWSDVEWWFRAQAKTIWINNNSPKNLDFCTFQVNTIKEIYNLLKNN